MKQTCMLLGVLAIVASSSFAAQSFPATGTAAVIPAWVLVESSTASTVGEYAKATAYNQPIWYLVNNIPSHFTVTGSAETGPAWSNLYSSLANNTWTDSSGAIYAPASPGQTTIVFCGLDERTGIETFVNTDSDVEVSRSLDMSAYTGVEVHWN